MSFSLLLNELSLLESLDVVLVNLLNFALSDQEQKFLILIDVSLLGFDNKSLLKYDNFFLHSITETDFESWPNLLLNIILEGSFNSCKVEYFSFRSAFVGIKVTFFSKNGFCDFLIFELNVIKSVKAD